MPRRVRSSVLIVPAALSVLAWSPAALGASKDAAALKLRKQAVYTDYLATDFAAAETDLGKALALCAAPADCEATTRGRLHCDLGAIYVADSKKDEAVAQFTAALKDDPSVTIDTDVASPEAEQVFAAAKGGGAGAAAGGTAEGTEGDMPHAPPLESTLSGDCPPDFPGCHAKEEKKACQSADDCEAGQTCEDGSCAAPEEGSGALGVPAKRNWVSLSVQQDMLLVPGKGDGVCAGGSGYTCFDSGNNYYAAVPIMNVNDDSVNGGLGLATTRLLLGYDRVVGDNVMLGARLGYAIGGGPQRPGGTAFLPLHAEARVAYWFGRDPFGGKGFRVYVMASGGAAEVDASLPTYAVTTGSTQENQYSAWKKTGQGFVAAGPGMMYAFTPGMGITLEVKLTELLPTSGTALSAALGYAIGF